MRQVLDEKRSRHTPFSIDVFRKRGKFNWKREK